VDLDALKSERDKMKEALRGLENEQRQLDGQQKSLRQREIRAKRTLEALETLIGLAGEPDSDTTT
jgi:predicted  nucleic acid-binding Zn-ribbon protein